MLTIYNIHYIGHFSHIVWAHSVSRSGPPLPTKTPHLGIGWPHLWKGGKTTTTHFKHQRIRSLRTAKGKTFLQRLLVFIPWCKSACNRKEKLKLQPWGERMPSDCLIIPSKFPVDVCKSQIWWFLPFVICSFTWRPPKGHTAPHWGPSIENSSWFFNSVSLLCFW